jgi:biopolymer transport protein ExbD
MRRRRAQRKALKVNTDLKLMPLMNIIIALIPMLLLSAVFLEVKVIETSLPRDADASAAAAEPAVPPLDLAVHVRGDVYVIEGQGVSPLLVPRRAGASAPDSTSAQLLSQALRAITASHPGTTEVRIVAEARTHYQEVISLMDVARGAGLVNAALEGAGDSAPAAASAGGI